MHLKMLLITSLTFLHISKKDNFQAILIFVLAAENSLKIKPNII